MNPEKAADLIGELSKVCRDYDADTVTASLAGLTAIYNQFQSLAIQQELLRNQTTNSGTPQG